LKNFASKYINNVEEKNYLLFYCAIFYNVIEKILFYFILMFRFGGSENKSCFDAFKKWKN